MRVAGKKPDVFETLKMLEGQAIHSGGAGHSETTLYKLIKLWVRDIRRELNAGKKCREGA